MEEEQYCRTHHRTSEAAEIDTNITIHSKMNLDLGLLQIKDKTNVSNPLNLLIKILVEKSMNQSASNSNIEST
jgi:uncharacterized protein with von Willebrand factor type A (vWA) domain